MVGKDDSKLSSSEGGSAACSVIDFSKDARLQTDGVVERAIVLDHSHGLECTERTCVTPDPDYRLSACLSHMAILTLTQQHQNLN